VRTGGGSAKFLNAMAKAEWQPSVTGVKELHGAEHEVIPDRIEAAITDCGAGTDGQVTLKGDGFHLGAVLDKRDAGAPLGRMPPACIRRKGN
jgi:UDP-N-acetylglucosamine 1-carboxyvinyltransferase